MSYTVGMSTEQKAIIEQSLKAGIDRHATRRELISQGVSTQGFDEVYETILKEQGISEPRPQMPRILPSVDTSIYIGRNKHRRVVAILKMILLVAALAGLLLYGLQANIQKELNDWIFNMIGHSTVGSKVTTESLSFSDSILQTKVNATVASANIYASRMGSYEGVCKDISVVAPVVCKEVAGTFAIFVPLSDGTLYCVDSTKKTSGSVAVSATVATCK